MKIECGTHDRTRQAKDSTQTLYQYQMTYLLLPQNPWQSRSLNTFVERNQLSGKALNTILNTMLRCNTLEFRIQYCFHNIKNGILNMPVIVLRV